MNLAPELCIWIQTSNENRVKLSFMFVSDQGHNLIDKSLKLLEELEHVLSKSLCGFSPGVLAHCLLCIHFQGLNTLPPMDGIIFLFSGNPFVLAG